MVLKTYGGCGTHTSLISHYHMAYLSCHFESMGRKTLLGELVRNTHGMEHLRSKCDGIVTSMEEEESNWKLVDTWARFPSFYDNNDGASMTSMKNFRSDL